jgi:hypothetical protein
MDQSCYDSTKVWVKANTYDYNSTSEELKRKAIKFNATTTGKGGLKQTVDGCEKTTATADKIRSYKSISPLDEAQSTLHILGAFKTNDRSCKQWKLYRWVFFCRFTYFFSYFFIILNMQAMLKRIPQSNKI